MEESKLTIVLCGRNDQYGGDFKNRLSNSLKWNHQQAISAKARVELIFVEHNPSVNHRTLEDEISWPQSDHWHTKIIRHLDEANPEGFEEFSAKNVGITHASGEHVLVSNADIFLPSWVFENYRSFSNQDFWVADRLNIRTVSDRWREMKISSDEYCVEGGMFKRPRLIPHSWFYKMLPGYLMLRKNMYRVLPFLLKPGVQFLLEYHFTACGDFMLGHKNLWEQLGGFREGTNETAHVDSLFLLKVISHNFHVRQIPEPVLHQDHEHRYTFRKPTESMNEMLQVLLDEVVKFKRERKPILDTPIMKNSKPQIAEK